MANVKNNKSQNDVIMKEFWRDRKHFADIVNAVIFDGEQVVEPEELEEIDTDVSGSIRIDAYKETLKRTRDIVKKCYQGVEFNIIGLEIQEKIHLAMPLRTLVYDALGYVKEYNEIKSRNEKEGYNGRGHTEFLSKLKPSDKFHPIVTIVFYYGEEYWNGPKCLKDMMVDMPDKLADKFNDYQINLVQIRDAGKYNFNNEDVKFLFDFVADIYNDGDFDKILTEYEGKDVSVDLIELIGKITGTKELMTISDNVRKGKVTNMEMCSAMKKFQEDAMQKGKIEGRQEGRVNSIRTLMKKLNQTAEEAMDMLDIEEKDREMYRKLLEIKEQSDT